MAIDSGAQTKTAASFGEQGFGIEDQCKLQQVLTKKLGPSLISQRPASSEGQRVAFVETWKLISLANELFGFNGWSNSITSQSIDYVDEVEGRYHVGVSACVRVTLKDGAYHEELGYGVSEGLLSKGSSIEKARKEAVSDGLKRSLRHFGNALGNCLGDKLYLQWVVNAADARPVNCCKSSESLLSGLVTSSQMTASPAAVPPPVSSVPLQVPEAQQQPQAQQQQVLQLQLPHQTTALQTQRLSGPFQQQLPILQPIALATGTGGLNTSSAQQLFFVRPMSQAGLSPGIATLTAIPSSGLQTLTALPSSSLHTLTQLSQHPQLSQPTQLPHPTHLSQPSQLAQSLQQSSTQSIVNCSQQQAQHFTPLQQSVLTQHQPKTSITQAVNQIKTLFNKNKQPIFSTCPGPFNCSSISSHLPCKSVPSCATPTPVSSSSNSTQTLVHGGVVSSLCTPVVTAISSGVLQNGVSRGKSLNAMNTLSHIGGQRAAINNAKCLNSNIKIIQNRYQGMVQSNVPSLTCGHIRDIQPRISSQVSQQREKVNSNSSDSSESQSRSRLRVVCPPLESELPRLTEEQDLPLSKKKRARSRSIHRANTDRGEKASANSKDLSRPVKKACIPLVTIHCPLETNDHIEIKQEKMDYDDDLPTLAYPDPLSKCEVVIGSSYSLSSKDDNTSLASEKDNDGDDEDEDDESVTVAKAMNTLFREGIRGQDSDFDQVSDHLLKEVGKTCSPLKFSSETTSPVNDDSNRIASVATEVQLNNKKPEAVESSLPTSFIANEKYPSNSLRSSPSSIEKVIPTCESQVSKDVKMIGNHVERRSVSELSSEGSSSEVGTDNLKNINENAVAHVSKEIETLISTDAKKTGVHLTAGTSVLYLDDSTKDEKLGKNEVTSDLLSYSKNDTINDEAESSVEGDDQIGDKLCEVTDINTKNEIKSCLSKTKGKNEMHLSIRKCAINQRDMASNSDTSLKSKGSCDPAGPAEEETGNLVPTNAVTVEITTGVSLPTAEEEFKTKGGPSQSKTDASSQSKTDASSVDETGTFRENADAESKTKVDSESGAKNDTLLMGKAVSPLLKHHDSSEQKTDAASGAKTDVLHANKPILHSEKINSGSVLKTVVIPTLNVDSTSISEAEAESKMKTDIVSEVEINVSPFSVEAGTTVPVPYNSSKTVDALKVVTEDTIAAATNVDLTTDASDTSSCKSSGKDKMMNCESKSEIADKVSARTESKQCDILDDVHLPPNVCPSPCAKREDFDTELTPSLPEQDRLYEDLFETVNSPSSDNENSFMGFTDTLQVTVPTETCIVEEVRKMPHDEKKSVKQNWKFKFRARNGSATNTRVKKVGSTSSTSLRVQGSGCASSSRNVKQYFSERKKTGSDTESSRSAHQSSVRCARLPPSCSASSSREDNPLVVVIEALPKASIKDLSSRGKSPVTSVTGQTDRVSPQNHGITSDQSSEGSLSSASESTKGVPLKQLDAAESVGDGKTALSSVQEPTRTSVTAIITEDAAVSSLSTLVTNGSVLSYDDDDDDDDEETLPCIDRSPSPTIGRESRKDRLSSSPQAQHSHESRKLICSDLSVKKQIFKPIHGKNEENGQSNHVRKFESVFNGDVC
ncbi:DNA repair protein Rad52/59/22 [Trinorchestia longiramus]|nr:DNA repair protein Rad52/59/22 [Trinorchestia longiramus]